MSFNLENVEISEITSTENKLIIKTEKENREIEFFKIKDLEINEIPQEDSVGAFATIGTIVGFVAGDFTGAISGGFSGFITWLITYPLDVIKSRQISKNIKMSEAIKMRNFSKGIIPCLLRSHYCWSTNFLVFHIHN